MPRKISNKSTTEVAKKTKKAASKPIQKDAKVDKKAEVDKAVIASKDTVHYILILDDSGSMMGTPWNDLKSATSEFITTLSNSREAASCKISCVVYNSNARIAFEDEKPQINLNNKIQYGCGGTNYGAALDMAQNICDRTADQCSKFIFYFMSDGEACHPQAQIQQLRAKAYFPKIQFFACGFGHGGSFNVLKRLAQDLGGQMTKAPTVAELKQSMLFILRGDSSGAAKQSQRKGNAGLKPLWNRDKLEVGNYFSSVSYLKVSNIAGDTVTVENSNGGSWVMSKDLLVRDSWSADHFNEEIKTNMTELAQILTLCKDTIFTVSFTKQVTEAEVEASLTGANLSAEAKVKEIQKAVTQGQECVITGYLGGMESDLGRSLVIDVNSKSGNGYKQVDHRTIKSIIFKNVKYSLGKKTEQRELPLAPKEGDRWDSSKLQLNNWFSSTVYYKVTSILDNDHVMVAAKGHRGSDLKMARDILETEMNSSLAYDTTEKITKTDMVERMVSAGETVFTVEFNTKVSNDHISQVLAAAGNAPDLKQLAKQIVTGPEHSMTCYLTSGLNQLGRSQVISLKEPHNMNFRQVDHRTIKSLILQNVKYELK